MISWYFARSTKSFVMWAHCRSESPHGINRMVTAVDFLEFDVILVDDGCVWIHQTMIISVNSMINKFYSSIQWIVCMSWSYLCTVNAKTRLWWMSATIINWLATADVDRLFNQTIGINKHTNNKKKCGSIGDMGMGEVPEAVYLW